MHIAAFDIPQWFLWLVIAALYIKLILSMVEIYYESKLFKRRLMIKILEELVDSLAEGKE